MTNHARLLVLLALLGLVGTGGAFAQQTPPFSYQATDGQATGVQHESMPGMPGPMAAATGGCSGNTRNSVCGLAPGADLRVTCPTLLQLNGQLPQEIRLACRAATATPGGTSTPGATATGTLPPTGTATLTALRTSTSTATLAPTSTPPVLATLTSTLLPTLTATLPPVATSTPSVQLIEGVPLCTDHDSTRWHPLVKRDSTGTILCTYGHEHHADPTVLDSVFGPLPWGTISYPWETTNENHNKHNVYKWEVYQNPDCHAELGGRTIRYARVEYHGDANMGALTRFHSFFLQSEWCDPHDPSYTGRYQVGGWMDFGILRAYTVHPDGTVTQDYVPLPTDPTDLNTGNRRVHDGGQHGISSFVWYGSQDPGAAPLGSVGMGAFNVGGEDWGPVSPTSPNNPLLFWGGDANNSLGGTLELVDFTLNPGTDNFSGYADRHGAVVSGCTAPALDCVPFVVQNMGTGPHQFRGDLQDPARLNEAAEYDVMSPVTGKPLITWPN